MGMAKRKQQVDYDQHVSMYKCHVRTHYFVQLICTS